MLTGGSRRSDRIEIELPILLSGVDSRGKNFTELTRTLVVSQHGAKVVSCHELAPQQSLTLRCYKTTVDALAYVVGRTGQEASGGHYGLGLHSVDLNVWGIEFPGLDEATEAASRVLLECQECGLREVAYLDTFALEVLVANQRLMRPCRRCANRPGTIWKQASLGESRGTGPAQAGATANETRPVSITLAAEVGLRHPQFGKEVAMTETVWRGGFRFKSRREYDVGSVFDVALPFSQERASVFSPVRVLSVEPLPSEGAFAYNVAYIRAEECQRTMSQGRGA